MICASRSPGSWAVALSSQRPVFLTPRAPLARDWIEVWKRLEVYKPDLSMGLFLGETNEGIGIGAATIRALALRGVALDFDLYGPIADA